jgi:hypothetical protein
MPFLVKAISRLDGGHDAWLTGPRLGGIRTFAARDLAEHFRSERDAKEAIADMCEKANCGDIEFSVESSD